MARLGPDPLALRIPRGGGTATAYAYPQLDTVVWQSSERSPAIARVLAFDHSAGSIAYVDSSGHPGRIDLRDGTTGRATSAELSSIASADGWAIYGVTDSGTVLRLTPTGNWSVKLPDTVRQVFPQPDGSLLAVADAGDSLTIWRLIPPEPRLLDTARVPQAERAVRTQVGDRLYLPVDAGLVGVRSRDLSVVPSIDLESSIIALTPTPSGDRVYAITGDGLELAVVDRYRERVAATVELPGEADALRMDPLGRFLLVRAAGLDSAWVVAVATNRIVGAVATDWRADLPAVAPDGAIALATGKDVTFVSAPELDEVRVVRGAARDYWYFFLWSGFRPRAAGLDQPVEFQSNRSTDTVVREDSLDNPFAIIERPEGPDTGRSRRLGVAFGVQAPDTIADSAVATLPPFARAPSTPPPSAARDPRATLPLPSPPSTTTSPFPQATPAPAGGRGAGAGYIVSFAALLSPESAGRLASEIEVNGVRAHVVPTDRAGTVIHRVVLGPFTTRDAAERAGRASGRSFWVFEGNP